MIFSSTHIRLILDHLFIHILSPSPVRVDGAPKPFDPTDTGFVGKLWNELDPDNYNNKNGKPLGFAASVWRELNPDDDEGFVHEVKSGEFFGSA